MLNGLMLIAQFECKFKTQIEDSFARNDLCARVFGENAERQ